LVSKGFASNPYFGNNKRFPAADTVDPRPGGAQHERHEIMKDGIHPNYREVVFLDTSCDFGFVTRSSVATSETIKWKDGKEYPVYKIEISAESHPFYTGKQKIMDTAGRVDKFKKRYARKSPAA
jgi:large subunit ribosomal protein L31